MDFGGFVAPENNQEPNVGNEQYRDTSEHQQIFCSSLTPQDDGLLQRITSQTSIAFPDLTASIGSGNKILKRKNMHVEKSPVTPILFVSIESEFYPHTGSTRLQQYNPGNDAQSRGPFTASQFMELGQQTLIYRFISTKMAVPPQLLIPLYPSPSGFYPSIPAGWGGGYGAGSADPAPGRCHRTDGKKWRRSRVSIADQKYCERHTNRGRHRSRRQLQDQKSAVAGTTITTMEAVVSSGSASLIANPQHPKEPMPIEQPFKSIIGNFASDSFIDLNLLQDQETQHRQFFDDKSCYSLTDWSNLELE